MRKTKGVNAVEYVGFHAPEIIFLLTWKPVQNQLGGNTQ